MNLKRVCSVGTRAYLQGHKIFPEWDTNPTTFILSLKSFQWFLPLPEIPAFGYSVQSFDEQVLDSSPPPPLRCLSPVPSGPLPSSTSNPSPGCAVCPTASAPLPCRAHSAWLCFPSLFPDCSHWGHWQSPFCPLKWSILSAPFLGHPPSRHTWSTVLWDTLLPRFSFYHRSLHFNSLCGFLFLFQTLNVEVPEASGLRLFSFSSMLPPDLFLAGFIALNTRIHTAAPLTLFSQPQLPFWAPIAYSTSLLGCLRGSVTDLPQAKVSLPQVFCTLAAKSSQVHPFGRIPWLLREEGWWKTPHPEMLGGLCPQRGEWVQPVIGCYGDTKAHLLAYNKEEQRHSDTLLRSSLWDQAPATSHVTFLLRARPL